ncbi:MAG: DUF2269 family protein [Chitinophagaceae bacterium]|nr:MAG: DUF2269 family protein [Chitinophagaceae bacterium]
MNHLFSIGLFIHIIGITCIAGGSIGGLVLESHIWKHIHESPEKVHVLGPLMSKYPVIIQAGTLLMLFSGLLMLGALGWTVAGQWWFIIKMLFVVALVLNGMLVAKPNGLKLRKLVPRLVKGENVKNDINKIKRNMTVFHISELGMLLIVYLLAIFRF